MRTSWSWWLASRVQHQYFSRLFSFPFSGTPMWPKHLYLLSGVIAASCKPAAATKIFSVEPGACSLSTQRFISG